MGHSKRREVRIRSQSRVQVQGGNLLTDTGQKRVLQLAKRQNVKKDTVEGKIVRFHRKGFQVVAVVG